LPQEVFARQVAQSSEPSMRQEMQDGDTTYPIHRTLQEALISFIHSFKATKANNMYFYRKNILYIHELECPPFDFDHDGVGVHPRNPESAFVCIHRQIKPDRKLDRFPEKIKRGAARDG
jgi:hypothetical protein